MCLNLIRSFLDFVNFDFLRPVDSETRRQMYESGSYDRNAEMSVKVVRVLTAQCCEREILT